MKAAILFFISLIVLHGCNNSPSASTLVKDQLIVSEDIDNFWAAYDAIHSTTDSTLQEKHLKELFLDKASRGQKRMIKERRYTAEEFLHSIINRPQFWNSIRSNTEDLFNHNAQLKKGVQKVANIYPDLTLSEIYYTIGNFRSPGTGVDDLVLIGTEFALGDTSTIVEEIPPHNQGYFDINPTDWLQFLTIHEYIHTQQKPMVHNLLCLTLYEGIAEFVSMTAMQSKSPWKAFTYGPANQEKVKQRFEEDMFRPNSTYSWLWNSPNNEFQTSELGYFIGSEIARIHYDNASDKKTAIKQLVELDFSNDDEVEKLVDGTNFFSAPISELYKSYESRRPTIVKIEEFENGSTDVDPNVTTITLHFSEPMNTKVRGFDYGPLGESNVLRVAEVIGWSNDNKTFKIGVKFQKGQRYQTLITNRFESAAGMPLKPLVVDITTR